MATLITIGVAGLGAWAVGFDPTKAAILLATLIIFL